MSGTNMRNKFRLSEYLLLKLKEIIKYKFEFFSVFCCISPFLLPSCILFCNLQSYAGFLSKRSCFIVSDYDPTAWHAKFHSNTNIFSFKNTEYRNLIFYRETAKGQLTNRLACFKTTSLNNITYIVIIIDFNHTSRCSVLTATITF